MLGSAERLGGLAGTVLNASIGPEASAHREGESSEGTQGKRDLAEHLFSSPAWPSAGYLGLYRAPAASANVASAAAVNSRCFQLFSFARIDTHPPNVLGSVAHQARPRHRSS